MSNSKFKYTLLTLLLLLSCNIQLSAQKNAFDINDFKKKKAEFIIKKTGLTDAEAKAFIPITNELMDKRFEINREVRKNVRELRKKNNKTEADYERLINESTEAKLKEAQLNKEYLVKFKKVLSAEKIYKYLQAEEDFMKQTLSNRHGRK